MSGLNPLGLIQRIAVAVGKPVREEKQVAHTTTGEAGLAVAKAKHARTATTVEPAVAELAQRSAEVPWELIKVYYGEHLNRDNPLILLCDEAQNMGDDESTTPTRAFLDTLHHGDDGPSPIPVVPVFAGLSDTGDKIVKFGITRPAGGNSITLEGLSDGDAGTYVLKTLNYLGADVRNGTERSRWRDWFVKDCHGWPKHLRTAMTAVAEAMLEADTSRLRDLDANLIVEKAARFRNEYYGERLQATGYEDHDELYALLVDGAPPESGGTRLRALKEIALDYAREYATRRNKTLDSDAMVDAAIHAGLLQRARPGGYYACPIPSLRDYLGTGEEHRVPRPPIPDRGLDL